MTDHICQCGRPTRDAAFSCDHCGDQLARALGEVPWLDDELEITITKQQGIDYRRRGGSKGGQKPTERPLPGNWGASEARGHLRQLLVSWTKLAHEDRITNSAPCRCEESK